MLVDEGEKVDTDTAVLCAALTLQYKHTTCSCMMECNEWQQ